MKINTGIVPSASHELVARDRRAQQNAREATFRVEQTKNAPKSRSKAINAYTIEVDSFPPPESYHAERVVKGPFLDKPQHKEAINSYLQNENMLYQSKSQPKSILDLYL